MTELKKHGFSVGQMTNVFFPMTRGGPTVDNSHPLIEVFGLPYQGPSTFHLSNPLHPNISMYCSLYIS